MNFSVAAKAWDDYQHWQATDPKLLARPNAFIRGYARTPFTDMGKLAPLRGNLSGCSRRITHEHRMVYKVTSETLLIGQCRNHD